MSTSESRLDEPARQRTDAAASALRKRISPKQSASIEYSSCIYSSSQTCKCPPTEAYPRQVAAYWPASTRGMKALEAKAAYGRARDASGDQIHRGHPHGRAK